MTINKVKEILNGTFADHADREYWERKLSDMERKAATAAENDKYFKAMAKCDR